MKKILIFAGSNSSKSINHQLAIYAGTLLQKNSFTLISLADYPLPVYSVDVEAASGIPAKALLLHHLIKDHDAYIISVAEHNRSVTVAFKNTMDWLSRIEKNFAVFQNKQMLLLSTSPGPGGGKVALHHAESILNGLSGRVLATFSFPDFFKNAIGGETMYKISDEVLAQELKEIVRHFDSNVGADVNEIALKFT